MRLPNGRLQRSWLTSVHMVLVATTRKDLLVIYYFHFVIISTLDWNTFTLVIVVPFAGMDMWGCLHSMSRADFIRGTIQNLEHYMRIGFEQSKTRGPSARQFVILFDMKDFNLKQYTWRPGKCVQATGFWLIIYAFHILYLNFQLCCLAGEVVIALIKMYEANYPEVLKCCYIINGNIMVERCI